MTDQPNTPRVPQVRTEIVLIAEVFSGDRDIFRRLNQEISGKVPDEDYRLLKFEWSPSPFKSEVRGMTPHGQLVGILKVIFIDGEG